MGKGLLLREFSPFASLIDEFFQEARPAHYQGQAGVETEDGYEWSYTLPGVSNEDLAVEVKEGRLEIQAQKKEEADVEGRRYHARERRFGKFERSFRLPQGADWDRVEAELKDGILTIRAGKKPEAKPKKITIQ